MEATLEAEMAHEPMKVTAWQEKLLKKLSLEGLSNWTPRNVAAARELILAFHDIFVLDGCELGCTSAIEHKICISDSESFKEWFRHTASEEGTCLTPRHAGCKGNMTQPVPVVQCGGIG